MNKRERIQALEARVLELEAKLSRLEGMAHTHAPLFPPPTTAKPWWLGPSGTGDPISPPYEVTCTDMVVKRPGAMTVAEMAEAGRPIRARL